MITVARWTGIEIRALREARRMSVREFAEHLGVTHRQVSNWEAAGPTIAPRPVNQAALDTSLRTATQESQAIFAQHLDGSAPDADGTRPEPGRPAEAAFPTTAEVGNASGRTAPAAYIGSENADPGLSKPLLGDPRHRERTLIMSAANESAAFAQRAGQTNVHPSGLEQIESEIARISRDYLTRPLVPLIGEMRYARNMTFTALEGRQYPSQTRQLYRYAALLCGLLASASSDLAFYDAAQTQARTAKLCAEHAEDPAIQSWILAIQSLIAFWDERPEAAADHAVAGQAVASTPIDLLRLTSLEARARARLGDLERTREAIGRGQEILEASDVVRHSTIFDFPAANALRCFGSAYLWLGAFEPAHSALEQALQLFEVGPTDPVAPSYAHLAVTRIDLALVHLGRGEIDAADETLRPVLSLSPERRLSGIVRRSHDLHLALAKPRYATAHTARRLTAEIESYCSTSARHALSDGVE